MRRAIKLIFCGILAIALTACKDEAKADSETSAAPVGIEKTYARGPVTLTLRVDNESPTIADKIKLEVEMTAEEDYQITPPNMGAKLGGFEIADASKTQPELTAEGSLRETQTFVLEPFLSGEYTLPSLRYQFQKKGAEEVHEILTEELVLTVSSLLPDAAENLEIHEIGEPVALPRPKLNWKLWVLILAGLILLAILGFILGRRLPKGVRKKKVTPAHMIALAALRELEKEGSPAPGASKDYYQKISDILRSYIENRFGLSAPERTTEEFLEELQSGSEFNAQQQSLLQDFLKHCDLVKFASHTPSEGDIKRTFDSCENFIVETKPV